MPVNDDVSHGDIYHKLGMLEGKLEAVLIQIAEKRGDMTSVFGRLREVEAKVATGVGIAIVASLALPLAITMASPKLHFNGSAAEQVR